MKELEIRPNNLTREPHPSYSMGGDKNMAENGQEDTQPKKISVQEGTERLERAGRQREERENQPRQATGGGVGRGNGGERPPTPPIPEGPEAGDTGSEQPSGGESSGEQSSSQKQEDVNSIREDEISRGEFVQRATQYLNVLKTSEFKPIFSRAISASQHQIAEIHEELTQIYNKLHDTLYIQRVSLKPEDPNATLSEENLREQARIDNSLNIIKQEYGTITEVLRAQVPRARGGEEEQIINDIRGLEEKLKTADEASKEKIVLDIKDKRVALFKMQSPESNPISDEVLIEIGRDEVATEEFMGRLLAAYQEDSAFQIRGLYGSVNLDVFLKVNQDMSPDRMDRLKNLIQGSEAFHNMNYIIKRSFDNFVEQSKVLLPRHFEVIMQIPGVSQVFRTYERLSKEVLGEETRLTEASVNEIEKEVTNVFKNNGEGDSLGIESYDKREVGKKMEDWEINRALIYGRNLYKASVRAAEVISQSELLPDSEVFTSPPLKELTQIMHTLKYVSFRFKPNESQGGFELIDEVLKKRIEKRRRDGKVRIKTLEGTDVDMRELQQIVSSRGVFATWRSAYALLKEVKFREGDKVISVAQFFNDHKIEIERFKDLGENDGSGWDREYKRLTKKESKKDKKHTDEFKAWRKDYVTKLFNPLLKDNSVALGILVSGNGLTVPSELKEMIWERIAELNPLVTASLLTRLEVDEKPKGAENLAEIEALEDILLKEWGGKAPHEEGYDLNKDPYALLRGKSKKDLQGQKIDPKEEIRQLEDNLVSLTKKETAGIITEEEKEKMKSLGKELSTRKIEIRGGKARELKSEIEGLEKELGELIGKESKQKGRISDIEAKRIEEITKDLTDKKKEHIEVNRQLKDLFKNEKWVSLKNKLNVANELRLKNEIRRIEKMNRGEVVESPKELKEYLSDFGEDEIRVVSSITKNGKEIAQDLASIKQVTTWFLNDTPLEIMKWTNLGQVYDRMTNDMAHFSKASGHILKALSAPFAVKPHDFLKTVREAMGEAGDVLGLEVAQENMEPILNQYLEMIYEKPKNFWGRQIVWSSLEHGRKRPTSRAQEITGSVESPSANEDAMYELTEEALHMGAYRKEVRDKETGKLKYKSTMEHVEEELKLQWYRRYIFANFRDYGPFFLGAFFIQFFRDIFKDAFSGK